MINDVEQGEQHRFPVLGKTFSLRRLPTRRCVGRFDLASYTKEVCPLNVELLPDAKDTMCPACQEATGFNPSFYYADFISAQQRAYNLTPHFTYLAYFSPKHVKAGISSETRGIERLLEQIGKNYAVRVATSDGLIQLSALRAGTARPYPPGRERRKLLSIGNLQLC